MGPTEPQRLKRPAKPGDLELEFLSDADAIEERPLPRAARLILHSLVALIVALVVWAAVSEIDRVVTARGKLVTTPATIVIQPLETAVVRAIEVKVGEVVRKGDTLVLLDSTFTTADVTQLRTRLNSLDAQIRRLEAELARADGSDLTGETPDERLQQALFRERQQFRRAKLTLFDENVGRINALQNSNTRDQAVLKERVKAMVEVERMREELHQRQTGSRLLMLESREQRLTVEQELQRALNKEFELRQELAVVEAERRSFEQDWQQKALEELVTAKRERDGLSEQLAKAERRSELVVMTAPSDAVVLEVAKRSLGSVVREAEPLVTLVPLDAPLEAEVQIEARDVGYLRAGDPARIKIDAFPFQKHGTVSASLRTISEDAFARERAGPEQGSEAYYMGRLDMGQMELRGISDGTRLLPGMTLSAEISVGKRTVLSYFLYPLMRGLDESIREP
ncbi:HlyD family type I secretion periplasmic adaptor subunit [Azospirillum halopraeferens]|uniref:HlyD family type I secretion periplasmic adaptor subunit n=1 Tax=Azospirillum halopraeferens TaxID=34010 RepID=UPI000405D5F8|nr:HlyD family type I secretion periplasmic adaptor subunit [Azospirillum halopraeferens]